MRNALILVESPGSPDASASEPSTFKRPESVLVVVCTLAGDFLLLRRTRPKGFWQSVTGSLAPGETPRAAALRELAEETGLAGRGTLHDLRHSARFSIPPHWRKGRYAPGVHYNLEHWFALWLDRRRPVRLNPRVHLAHRWLPASQAATLTRSWTNRSAILTLAGLARFG
ncbi:dihydroneopterin triphosphate diphosphatase [Thioalkalicoccus limnaeus]|uniref:dihydroneopterin triphosphate diphosphatase n=1 Tax=Thioalkalicoccus limnaeus TaxID=120681 RepID=UPI003F747558